MKTSFIGFFAALPVTLMLGCGAPETQTADTRDDDVAESAQAIGTFTFDSTALRTAPAATIPTDRLTLRAFDQAMVQRALVQTTEPFTVMDRVQQREMLESAAWSYELDGTTGSVLIVRKTPSGAPATPDEAVLQRNALARLNLWGIPNSEIGSVVQRRSLRDDQDGTATTGGGPQVHRYKTFVYRAINGVRVEGHRAVVTHTLDGSFNRALVKWPAIASSGHRMRTRLTLTEIESRAASALTAEGETGGSVKLSWKYVATPLTTGEVALTLKVSAFMGGAATRSGVAEEPRQVDVDISAL